MTERRQGTAEFPMHPNLDEDDKVVAPKGRAIEAARRITTRYVSSKLEGKAEDAIRQIIEGEIKVAYEAGRSESPAPLKGDAE